MYRSDIPPDDVIAGCRTPYRWGCWALVCALVCSVPPQLDAAELRDAEIEQALAVILAAQPGQASAPAAAWRQVGDASYAQLPLVFAALDRADGLAVNWISMALDRMVERQGVERLPAELLSATALDQNHQLITRKMALDLLGRVDAEAVDRLQVKMMHDSEAELRRGAIEMSMAAAVASAAGGASKPQQIRLWLDVLRAARDEDQVMRIARELKKLDQEVDLGAQFGYLIDWYIIGPFDNADGKGFDTPQAPEALTLEQYQQIVAGTAGPLPGRSGPVRWKLVQAKPENGDVNLNEGIEKLRSVLAYGATVFQSERAQQVDVRLRIQNSFKIWLNGQLLTSQPVGHTGNSFDQYMVRADLRAGPNLFVVKSCQVDLRGATEFYDNWHFCVRVCDATGGAILAANRVSAAAARATQKGGEQ